jgi:hypothetical protein
LKWPKISGNDQQQQQQQQQRQVSGELTTKMSSKSPGPAKRKAFMIKILMLDDSEIPFQIEVIVNVKMHHHYYGDPAVTMGQRFCIKLQRPSQNYNKQSHTWTLGFLTIEM